MNSPLLPASEADFDYLDARITCASISEADFPGWEDRLKDPAASPIPHMRKQRQVKSDCQGQALANGTEARVHASTGQMVQLADIYAYNATEYVSDPRSVGADRGSNILQGVVVLTEGIKSQNVPPGLPTESDWPYNTYEKSASRFIQRAKQVKIQPGCVAEQLPMPPFREMLIALAARGTGHIGTYWPPRWSSLNGRRLMDSAPTGGGGHATCIIWAHWLNSQWYLCVWNSHGDEYYYMSQRSYDRLQSNQFRPFGARLLMPMSAQQQFVDWHKNSPYFA